jgi:hypothetical protein
VVDSVKVYRVRGCRLSVSTVFTHPGLETMSGASYKGMALAGRDASGHAQRGEVHHASARSGGRRAKRRSTRGSGCHGRGTVVRISITSHIRPHLTLACIRALGEVRSKLNSLAEYSFVKSIRHQGDIKTALDGSDKLVDLHLKRLSVMMQTGSLRLQEYMNVVQQYMKDVQERDQTELREALQLVVNNTRIIRATLVDDMERPEAAIQLIAHNAWEVSSRFRCCLSGLR